MSLNSLQLLMLPSIVLIVMLGLHFVQMFYLSQHEEEILTKTSQLLERVFIMSKEHGNISDVINRLDDVSNNQSHIIKLNHDILSNITRMLFAIRFDTEQANENDRTMFKYLDRTQEMIKNLTR